ncbi:hypothetical protein [Vibrio harveyi]|uniref:hypothetical protein n=1 Tax=Vibrio harveyi TaxID=669 RepID=UPI003CF512F5
MNVKSIRPIPKEAFCIGCGCSDSKACFENNQACYWLKLDREKQIGVCSNCKSFLSKFGEL